MKRSANAHWEGSGKEGKGHISLQSGHMKEVHYSFVTRFGDDKGTNPEELLAAAHAGCFTMKLSFNLTTAGHVPQRIDTQCEVTLDAKKGEIISSHLTIDAHISGISEKKFTELLHDAKDNCPVSKLFNTEISCTYTLHND